VGRQHCALGIIDSRPADRASNEQVGVRCFGRLIIKPPYAVPPRPCSCDALNI
jgi:hypothetical protein